MNRIPPSERMRAQIGALFQGDFQDQEDLVSQLARLGAKLCQQRV